MRRIHGVLAAAFGLLITTSLASAQTCTPKVAPADLVKAGEWTMVTNPTIPPQQYVDAKGELQGLNIELPKAIAERLCLKPIITQLDFPAMIPGLQAARFDTINTGLFWTEERSEIMFLVPYAKQTIAVLTEVKSDRKISSLEDLSGATVGCEIGGYACRRLEIFNKSLVEKGRKPINLRTFANPTETTAALRAGQLDALTNVDETAALYVQRGIAKIVLSGLEGSDITLAFRNKNLALAVANALTELRAEGTYDRIFEKFGMTRLDGKTFAIRGPGPK